MQIMEQNDIYMCPKHNQIIQLIVMEKGIKPADQMLCLECMNENRSPSNNIFSVKQAKEMIKEQLTLKFIEQEESIKQQLGKIQTIQKTLIEFRQNVLKSIDTITQNLGQWMNDLNNLIQNNDQIELIKGLEKLQMEKIQFDNLIEQNNYTFCTKIDLAFQKVLNNKGFEQCYQQLTSAFPQQTKKNPLNHKIASNIKFYDLTQELEFHKMEIEKYKINLMDYQAQEQQMVKMISDLKRENYRLQQVIDQTDYKSLKLQIKQLLQSFLVSLQNQAQETEGYFTILTNILELTESEKNKFSLIVKKLNNKKIGIYK